MSFTVGSLFDGSGGFPLAAFMCGGVPVWASEVEPYPIAVTKTRFPYMKHLGSVTDIKGSEVEPVDVITFGSPCQDLSVAGKRAGLKHEDNGDDETTRSGLFMEAVRIIKEMREATGGKFPRIALWENVPGAFSSNKGEDFRVVCEELIKIVEPTAVMPTVPKNGWPYSDCYSGDGWSLAYRVLDSQFWGVPQRRKRIYLVLDLGGQCAGEVSFKREGLRGYFEEGRTPWKAVTGDAERGSGTADCERDCVKSYGWPMGFRPENTRVYEEVATTICNGTRPGFTCGVITPVIAIDQQGGKGGANYAVDVMPTICSDSHGTPHAVAYSFDALSSNSMKSNNPHSGCRQVEVARTLDCFDPSPAKNQGGIAIVEPIPYLLKIRSGCEGGGKGALIQEDKSATISTLNDQYLFQPCVVSAEGFDMYNQQSTGEVSRTLKTPVGGDDLPVACIKCWDARGNGDGSTAATITGDHENRVTDYTSLVCEPVVYNGENITHPLNKTDPQPGDPCHTLGTDSRNYVVCGVDCRNATEYPEMTGALQADCAHNLNSNSVVRVQYIVRRLTPTECSRLQGFPDFWGHPDRKDSFTDEEYEFWLNVRNTHAEINGKAVKSYTKDQMLNWYNKLHTDSAEYKLWGNGIALPTALYMMQGIADVFK